MPNWDARRHRSYTSRRRPSVTRNIRLRTGQPSIAAAGVLDVEESPSTHGATAFVEALLPSSAGISVYARGNPLPTVGAVTWTGNLRLRTGQPGTNDASRRGV